MFRTDTGAGGRFEKEVRVQEIDRISALRPPHPMAVLGPIHVNWGSDVYVELTLPEYLQVRRLTGRVLDVERNPVSAASVSIQTPSKINPAVMGRFWLGGPWLYPSAKSDAQGNFSLEALPQREALLQVQADGFEPYRETLDTRMDTEKYVFLKRPQIFSVVVLDAQGQVRNGMKAVGETEDDHIVLYPAATEGEYYSVQYPFRIYAEGLLTNQGITQSKWIERYQRQVVLVLGRGKIIGIVTDEDRNPVKDFNIYVREAGDASFDGRSGYGVHSEDGSFILNNLPPGKAVIQITRQTRAGATSTELQLGSKGIFQDVVVEEGRSAFVRAVLKGK